MDDRTVSTGIAVQENGGKKVPSGPIHREENCDEESGRAKSSSLSNGGSVCLFQERLNLE